MRLTILCEVHSWYCIRKANVGLANLDKMVGTQEEKDMIAGQLYFSVHGGISN